MLKHNPDKPAVKLRGNPKNNTPFMWASTDVLMTIWKKLEAPESGIFLYLVLCWLAADQYRDHCGLDKGDAVTCAHKYLAGRAHLSVATVKRRLKDLEQLGLLAVETPERRDYCTYRLLKVTNS